LTTERKDKKNGKNKLVLKKDNSLKKNEAMSLNQEDIEKYRKFFDNIHDGCFETDLAGNIIFLNDSLCRLLGYSRKELMKMNVRQLADKETLKKVFPIANQVHKTGKTGQRLWLAGYQKRRRYQIY
jgi:PAS domain S-box-containing protein